MANKRTIEQMYPNKRARKIADEAIEDLSNEESMLKFIIDWEEAYLAAGGTIHP